MPGRRICWTPPLDSRLRGNDGSAEVSGEGPLVRHVWVDYAWRSLVETIAYQPQYCNNEGAENHRFLRHLFLALVAATESKGDEMANRLEGKVAIVTGGNSGIGEATGKVLGRRGRQGRTVSQEAGQRSSRASRDPRCRRRCHLHYLRRKRPRVGRGCGRAGRRYVCGVQILVNNAGGGALGGKAGEPMRLESNATWDRVISVNLTGPFYMTRVVWPHMVEAGGGVITNISSGAAGAGFTTKLLEIGGGFDVSSYYASKAGLEGFTRVTASMGGPDNIRVNAIRPQLIVDKRRPSLARGPARPVASPGRPAPRGRHRQNGTVPQL